MADLQYSFSDSSAASEDDDPQLRQRIPQVKKFSDCMKTQKYEKRKLVAEKLTALNESLRVHGKLIIKNMLKSLN